MARTALVLALLLLIGCASRGVLSDTNPQRRDVVLQPAVVTAQSHVQLDNGTVVNIPKPALWPSAATTTREFQQWVLTGNIRTLRYQDTDGWLYVGEFDFVFTKPNDPRRYAHLAGITRYRPDGTVESKTRFDGQGSPMCWTTFSTDGTTPTLRVIQSDSQGRKRLIRIELFDESGQMRPYQVMDDGTAFADIRVSSFDIRH